MSASNRGYRPDRPLDKPDELLWDTFELIWLEDAPHVEGGAKELDALAVRIGLYLGVDHEVILGPDDE